VVIRPSRDSGEANLHPNHARARRRAEGKARLRFRLTCVTRIFQKSVFTKFAHGSWARCRWANVWSPELATGDGCGNSLRCGSPFPAILTVIALLFFLGPSATPAKSAVPGATQGCRWSL